MLVQDGHPPERPVTSRARWKSCRAPERAGAGKLSANSNGAAENVYRVSIAMLMHESVAVEQSNPEMLGTSNGDLPYLFKVLSVQKALSIQVRPVSKCKFDLQDWQGLTLIRMHARLTRIFRWPASCTRTSLICTKTRTISRKWRSRSLHSRLCTSMQDNTLDSKCR